MEETGVLKARLDELAAQLNSIERKGSLRRWPSNPHPDEVHIVERKKFNAIDIGHSGAWLVDKATGEIYNISGYGRPDYNKKKADIGNIFTVAARVMHGKRYNYLR